MQDKPENRLPSNEEHVFSKLLKVRERAIAFCYVVVPDYSFAEDLYQEACLVVIRRISEYRGTGFDKWFWKILRNVLGTHIRSLKRSPILANTDLINRVEDMFKEQPADDAEENHTYLIECLKKLRGHMRKVLEWRFVENIRCNEIARRLKRTPQAAYSIIKRARKILKECVERRARAAGENC